MQTRDVISIMVFLWAFGLFWMLARSIDKHTKRIEKLELQISQMKPTVIRDTVYIQVLDHH